MLDPPHMVVGQGSVSSVLSASHGGIVRLKNSLLFLMANVRLEGQMGYDLG